MKNSFKKASCIVLIFCLLIVAASFSSSAKTRISSTKKTITAGKTFKLKVYGAKKTVKWSSSNSKVAKIKSKSGAKNYCAKIKGLKKGTATITAKVGSKKFKCKVTVKKKSSSGSSGTYVYITNTGKKYHRSGCSFLKHSKIKISLASAKAQGYKPCKKCNPPH